MSHEKWASWQQLAARKPVEVKSEKIFEPSTPTPPPAIEPVVIPEPVESVEITADILAEEPKPTLKKIKKNTD